MAAATLTARPRQRFGKNAMRRLRHEGFVPAVVYGRGEAPQPLMVSAQELERLLSSIVVESTVVDVRLEGGAPFPALIREVQYHPAKPQVLHVDLFHLHAGEKVHLELPVRLHGTPVGVRDNAGVLQQVLHALSVECLPSDIPEAVDVQVDGMQIGDALHVRDLDVQRVKVLNDADLVVCTVTAPTVQALPEVPETDIGVGGDVEPELIRGHADDAKDVPFQHGSAQPE